MRFNQVQILDTIPRGERNTATRLYDDLLIRASIFAPTPEVLYQRVESSREALDFLQTLARRVAETGNIPILHLECHAGDEGIRFADNTTCTWRELKPYLTELNLATEMNLLVVMASCDGHAITHTVQPVDKAPLFALIGSTCELFPPEIERGFLAFYSTLFQTRTASLAFRALCETRPDTYVYRSAEMIFQAVWDYCQQTQETEHGRRLRGEEFVRKYQAYIGPEVTADMVAALYRERNRHFFDLFRREFFLIDRYPHHEQRFAVVYRTPEDYEAAAPSQE